MRSHKTRTGWRLNRVVYVVDGGCLSEDNLQTLARGGSGYIVCSHPKEAGRQRLHRAEILGLLEAELKAMDATREELGPMYVTELLDFLSWFVMGEEALADYVGDARLNTDDHPFLEFTPAMAFFVAGRFQIQNLARFQESRESVLPLLANMGDTEEERIALAERVQKRFEATQYALRGDILFYLGRRDEAREEYTRAMLADPESQEWLNAMKLF